MTLQEIICQRQNSPEMLDCQYAARHYYNMAEKLNYWAVILSLISECLVLLPNSDDPNIELLSLAIPVILGIVAYICNSSAEKNISAAATLRNYFDDIVLGFEHKRNYDKGKLNIIKNHLANISDQDKKNENYQAQITNNGRSIPPGVKDWYEFSGLYSDSEVIFECQKQNAWWNSELHKRRVINEGILLIGIYIAIFLGYFYFKIPLLKIIICSISILYNLADKIKSEVQYRQLSEKIENIVSFLSTQTKRKGEIKNLQKLISERRELHVVECNHIHRVNSKRLSEKYEKLDHIL